MDASQRGVAVGAAARDFQLRDHHGQPVRLSSYWGTSGVLLVFYPFAFSAICGRELHDLQQNLDVFRDGNVAVLAVSVDSMYCQRVFAEQEGFGYPHLADFWPHGAVARSYGVFSEGTGTALRATFLIDSTGIVRWKIVKDIGQVRDVTDCLQAMIQLRVDTLGGTRGP